MPWFNALLGEPFLNWLRAAADHQYAPQLKGDPFSTSMRDFDDVASDLQSIAEGKPAKRQRLTDLRAAKLVQTDGDSLSELGLYVLDGWKKFGVFDSEYENELPRQLILVFEALRINDQFYRGLAEIWRTEANRFGADKVIENWANSFVQSYFSKPINGYSPMDYVGELSDAPVWNTSELTSKVSSMVSDDDKAILGLNKISTALDGAVSRGKARKIFIIALCLATEPTDSSVRNRLTRWTLPLTSTTAPNNHSLLPESIIDVCINIAEHYRGTVAIAQQPRDLEILIKRKNVILFGPPGTGKTHSSHQIADYWRGRHGEESVVSITFHPSYSYEDFVWGWRPDRNNPGNFLPQDGALLKACEISNTGVPTLVLIDEINRADTARVFGELITYIEADKRGRTFRIAQDAEVDRCIPNNLYFLGTMNTADRSVSLLDVALRRRFAFIEYTPDPEVFNSDGSWCKSIQTLSIGSLMVAINSRLSQVGVESDRSIGHALFFVSNDPNLSAKELHERFEYDIYPLVVDYCFSDRTRVTKVLGNLVSSDGRFLKMSTEQFIGALQQIVS